MVLIISFHLVSFFIITSQAAELSPEVLDLIHEWAPLVWMHSEELYNPSSVEFHLRNTEVRSNDNDTLVQASPTRETIITGSLTDEMHLHTIPDLECGDCVLDWFAGEDLSVVPTYAYVKPYNDSCNTIDVAYRNFYPYNFGKDVCIGLTILNRCKPYDIVHSFGNHVGDWEHFGLRFQNNEVVLAEVGAHSFGAIYEWNATANMFTYKNEESRINFSPTEYPETVELVEGNHPEVFSANGSHGLWSEEGKHEYVHVTRFFTLKDQCDRGSALRTWENMEIVVYDPNVPPTGANNYMRFEGRWGGDKMGCKIVEPIFGECVLGNGPSPSPFWPNDFGPNICP